MSRNTTYEPFGWMTYTDNTYHMGCYNTGHSPNSCGGYDSKDIPIDEISRSLSYRLGNNTVFVIQTPNDSQKTFHRKLLYVRIQKTLLENVYSKLFFTRIEDPTEDKTFKSINDIDERHQMIGLFMYGSDTLYVLFRDNQRITYCLISDVSDQWIHN